MIHKRTIEPVSPRCRSVSVANVTVPAIGDAPRPPIRQHGVVPADGSLPNEIVLAKNVLADLEREPMGLYEVWYSANTLFPETSMSARLATAEQVIRRLATDGSVRLWRGRWIGPQHEREGVTTDDLADVLLRFSTWAPEDGEPVVWMELSSDAA